MLMVKANNLLLIGVIAWIAFADVNANDDPVPPQSATRVTDTTVWPRRLGPNHNATVPATKLIDKFPEGGPKILWEAETGEGYAAPVIVGDRLVWFHRLDNRATIDCLNAKTGKRSWRQQYETNYSDRYGFSGGPRCSPLIDGNRVYVYGVEGELRCMKLADGSTVWRTNTLEQFGGKQEYFGAGAGPLIEGELLILNVGAPKENAAVVAFNKLTGAVVWKVGNQWGASYAAAVPTTINGRRVVLIFAGGDSRPPTGGLLVIEPRDGKLLSRYPFRSKTYESVNASSPVVWNEKVFISTSYNTGGVLLEFDDQFNAKPVWTTTDCGSHFMTPVVYGDHMYAIDGMNRRSIALTCIDLKTGKSTWRWSPVFDEAIEINGEKRTASFGIGLGSLLKVGDRYLLLTENGHLLMMKLTPDKHETAARTWLFGAQETWALPPLVDGLLYVNQNQRDSISKTKPRLICYDLRQETKP